MPRALDRDGQATLVTRARPCLPSGFDLAALGDVPAELERVLVVDAVDLVDAEGAHLLAAAAASAEATTAARAEWPVAAVTVTAVAVAAGALAAVFAGAFGAGGRWSFFALLGSAGLGPRRRFSGLRGRRRRSVLFALATFVRQAWILSSL